MGKKRIYELAKELNTSNKSLVEKAQALGFDIKNHMGSLSNKEENQLRKSLQMKGSDSTKKAETTASTHELKFQSQRNNPKFQNRKNQAPRTNATNRGTQEKPTVSHNKPVTKATNQPEKKIGEKENGKPKEMGMIKSQEQSGNKQTKPTNHAATMNEKKGTDQRPSAGQAKANQTNRSQNRNTNQGRTNENMNQTKPSATEKPKTSATRDTKKPFTQKNQTTNRPSANATNDRPAKNTKYEGAGNASNANSQERNKPTNRSNNRNKNNNFGNNQNRSKFNKRGKKGRQTVSQERKPAVPARKFRELPEVLEYTEGMNVADIAKKIHREPAEIIKKLFMLGVMVNQNQPLDKDTIELLATDYGMEAQEKVQVDIADIDKFFEPEELKEENLVSRPPVVTIMGHVDHGKTTLLDTLRHSRVTSGEAGGITQHIGAYQIDINGKPITFLDTPGHAAFTSMRARGASITDITILVVAADDGVMPQTVEAINHAKAAKVPIIVAVNKIDKPGANPQHVMQELSEYELIPESWGGDTIFVEISAKFGQNIDELLEMILLVAEVEDLKADPTQRAIGTVIEARLDKGKGPVATLLVQQGTLRVGDPIVVGNTFGRVRVMTNDIGRRDKAAGPATPVEITGLNDVPQAGDRFVVFEDEKSARAAGEERAKRALLEHRASNSRVTLETLFDSLKEGELKAVNVIIKADVQGSAEALAASLKKIDVEGVKVNIVHSAVGAVNESDVTLAAASNAIIIGFNVRPTPQAKQQADAEEVEIRLHRIIYKAIEEIETAMKGMLDPEFEEKITGQMIVRETYKVSKVGTIAGAYVTEGFIRRDSGVRVIRDGIVIYEGQLASLKRFKDDVKEVRMGFECGAMIEKFNDLKMDDVIEGFIMEEIKVD